jgi:hypothetical protein
VYISYLGFGQRTFPLYRVNQELHINHVIKVFPTSLLLEPTAFPFLVLQNIILCLYQNAVAVTYTEGLEKLVAETQ